MRLPENPTLVITNTARNKMALFGSASAAHPITPVIIKRANNGFFRFFPSATVPSTGPNTATIKVEIEIA